MITCFKIIRGIDLDRKQYMGLTVTQKAKTYNESGGERLGKLEVEASRE